MKIVLRKTVLMMVDAFLINLAVLLTLLIRFAGHIPPDEIQAYFISAPLFTIVTLATLYFFKIYNRLWEYASLDEVGSIVKASSVSILIVLAITHMISLDFLPRSIYIGSWLNLIAIIGGSRIFWRMIRERAFEAKNNKEATRRVLIVGAGSGGALLAREIQNNPGLKRTVVGFVDDDANKYKMILAGIPVLGYIYRVPGLVQELNIDEIIIAIPSAEGRIIREIYQICKKTPAQVRILPGILSNVSANLFRKLRQVQMEDLLRRQPVKVDMEHIAQYIQAKTVLVTGAGGSIGSELCRQILELKPSRLILLDNSENGLFEIENELLEKGLCVELFAELADVRNRDKLESIFIKHKPRVVFHAAAYKHVPMMEKHPEEAMSNNVNGTRIVAELADKYETETFIMISTDKAVNPTSIMGASKRIAELVVKDINRNSKTRFAVVRFGNVLGSRGSVVPIFMKQIESGGPITVTHPEMKRYFMTIPEAVLLVIQAGSMARGGEIFVLDMGEPIKIDDLARELIQLSGLKPDKDIDIVYTGIRPGEKLYEELFTDREGLTATPHERIFISTKPIDDKYIDISKSINAMLTRSANGYTEILKMVRELVPEYQRGNVAEMPSKPKKEQVG
ncbi:MAG: polysaccharide biosynthesis protein [Syntrophomonadaceae bacterium]|jgi:FlaA1/EpsC-like NDP-sugar epimerase